MRSTRWGSQAAAGWETRARLCEVLDSIPGLAVGEGVKYSLGKVEKVISPEEYLVSAEGLILGAECREGMEWCLLSAGAVAFSGPELGLSVWKSGG